MSTSLVTMNLDEKSWIIKDQIPKFLFIDNFDILWSLHPEEYGQVKIYGKLINTPRWQQCYMRDYTFSGITHKALPLPEEFKPYLEFANSLGHGTFNIALINYYGHGGHYIGKHSDNEPVIIPNSPIVSISLGATRTFRIRNKSNNEIIHDIELKHGTYLVMGGEMQKRYLHEVPKVAKSDQRINITFRQMI
jgi:alkylated DNA repair dioxygenase AlkB